MKLDHKEPYRPTAPTALLGELSSVWGKLTGTAQGAFLMGEGLLRMLPEADGFQVLCNGCHTTKTQGENDARRQLKKLTR